MRRTEDGRVGYRPGAFRWQSAPAWFSNGLAEAKWMIGIPVVVFVLALLAAIFVPYFR